MNDTITISESRTDGEAHAPEGMQVTSEGAGAAEPRAGDQRPTHFWADYRARRGERVPRADLRLAIALSGEPFCRRALASEVPFARSCAEEARGTRGELREALLRLALGGGRPVARELARQRSRALGERAGTMEVDQTRLEAALGRVGAEPAERVLAGRVGFRKAALFEGAMSAEDGERSEAWVALAAAGAGRVRGALRSLRAGREATGRGEVPGGRGDADGGPGEVAGPSPARGAALVASAGEELRSPFGAELARAVASAA